MYSGARHYFVHGWVPDITGSMTSHVVPVAVPGPLRIWDVVRP
jgi:hypothetical protein